MSVRFNKYPWFIACYILINCSPKKKPFHPDKSITLKQDYTFKTEGAEDLSILAFSLKAQGDYEAAIEIYQQAKRRCNWV